MGLFDNLFNTDKKILKDIEKTALPVLDYEKEMASLSDEELKAKTPYFKNRLANGETLDDILPEAFATIREAAKRVIGEFPYFCQIEGATVLHKGDIAEMKTGEGKTLTSVMAVYLNALTGKGVHVITVNEYLAERDSEWMGQIHRFLGLTVGLNKRELTPEQKRAAYECDITYTTNAEVGFDYLRDNMVTRVEDRVLRKLNFALVDEVDSILIDESRTPLIISGGEKKTANIYLNADRFVRKLQAEEDYAIDIKGKNVQLTEEGVHKGEKFFNVENLFDIENASLVHYINQALKANYIMKNDVDYVVEEGEVIIVDPNTGRKMPGREWSDGLHQAIQAKENVPIKQETTTLATITYQNFFRLYDKLAGMTGTAKTEEEEFLSIYNMRVVEIPTNKPVVRDDQEDLIFGTKRAKYNAIVEEVKRLHATGQPVLLGTISVETSELLSKMLKQARINHEVLNAKNHAREAEIIAKAGRPCQVTIATNMAGRGTDIKLTEESKALGGLVVLGSERHESRRIDNQLRGRSGRQGDPGRSQFYVSLQDDLMVRFGSDKIQGLFSQMGDAAIENNMVSKAISSAQKRVEGLNFDVRKSLLDYDDVMRQQRETMYEQRNFILENDDIHSVIEDMFARVADRIVKENTSEDGRKEVVDYEGVVSSLKTLGSNVLVDSIKGVEKEELATKIKDITFKAYNDKIAPVKNQVLPAEKIMALRLMDRAWVNQIDVMAKLRDTIHLRSYAQNNPLQAYVEEGFELFENMMNTISNDVVSFCNNVKVVLKEK
ncbi:MAG: preprotein translocase subunit SecA [Erysipelotrichaceae bacterium]|nr:preprotein translocase subunit SecA [Erysipelotrichaceae bacterium]